jgi:hypothetical protein
MLNQLIRIAFVANILIMAGSAGALNLGDLVNAVDKASKVAKQNSETNSNIIANVGSERSASISTYTNKSPHEITDLLQPESASSMTSPTPYPRHGHFFAALPSGCNETAAPVWL